MKKLKVIIADDEPDALEILGNILVDSGKVEVLERVDNPLKIESLVNKHHPDVLFLDIEMPNLNGLQLLENLREYNQHLPIIMVTAYDQYVSEAIKFNVFSYLSKPVDRLELTNLLDKLEMLEGKPEICNCGKIKLPVNDGYVYLKFEELFSLEAEGNYTIINTINQEQFVSSYNMGRLLKRLPENQFFRINRSMVLNSDYIYRVNKKQNVCYAKIADKEHCFDVSQVFISQFNRINR
ncbi:MAG: LytTR family DNA-binding domain-containing protein [Marinifilum sp.]|nr:LytTR family DNA-binding domain-containing protein [Marinifilum sp.]